MTLKDQFAKLYAEESLLWGFCQENKWVKSVEAKYKDFGKLQQELLENIPTALNQSLSGYCDNKSHHKIADKIRLKFKNVEGISVDSEGDGVYVDFNTPLQEDIENFLKEKYPTLEYTIDDRFELGNPWFSNWNEAELYCKQNDIKVELPLGLTGNPIIKELEDIDAQIEALKLKKEQLLNEV